VGAAWRPALDKVWDFLRTKPGLRTDGHNVFLYHHPARRDLPMDVDFGVEVVRAFEPEGEVHATETPAGEAAVAVITLNSALSPGRRRNLPLALIEIERRIQFGLAGVSNNSKMPAGKPLRRQARFRASLVAAFACARS
jgi:hypothetical protein